MGALSVQDLAFVFGLLGNIVSFLVFLAPVPTFHTIWKRKSSEGYQAIPYLVALFSASLLLYYAFLKKNAYMIVSINAFGCVIELLYLFIYMIYATKSDKIFATRFLLLLNIGVLGLVVLCADILFKGPKQVSFVGWACATVNLAVFASPLSIMRQVIRTKSVEFMPFTLSFFLTICAAMWFFYGFFISDYYIAVPNVVGFLLGISQMALYLFYKNAKGDVDMNMKLEGGGEEGEKDFEIGDMKAHTNKRSSFSIGKQENQD